MSEIRVGLVGAGKIAQVAQLPALSRRDDVQIAGLVTRTRRSLDENLKRWPIERGYESLDEMIASASLDALFVLTPRIEHFENVVQGLESGLDVFCEKPLATEAHQAHHLADLADSHDRLLQVGFNRRYAEVYVSGRDRFDGRADMCVAQKNRQGSEYRATFENAIHMVDLLRWFCGEPVEVSAHHLGDDKFEEDGLAALVRFEGGPIGLLVASRTAGLWDERLDAYGGGKSVNIIAPDSCDFSTSGITERLEMRPRAFGWANAAETLGFRACVDDFIECVKDRRQPLTSGREAALTQDLLETILEAGDLPTTEAPDRNWESHATR